MGALGAALALPGDCERGLEVLRDGLAKARASVIRPDRHGLPRPGKHAPRLRRARGVGRGRASRVPRGLAACGSPASARWRSKRCVPLGRWREAEAILASIPAGSDEGTGAYWNATFGGIIAVRAGRSADAQALLACARRRRTAHATLRSPATWLAASSSWRCSRLGSTTPGRSSTRVSTGWRRPTTSGSASRVLRLGVSVEAETATIARARRDSDAEAHGRSLWARSASSGSESSSRRCQDDTSPVFDEARGNCMLAEAEATRLVDRPDPAAWAPPPTRFTTPRRPYELAWLRIPAS